MPKHGVSLMAGEIKEEIKNVHGFCTEKFHADIITFGVDYKTLNEGDILELSDERYIISEEKPELSGKKIRITKVGKPCFPDCPVPPENKPCILNRNVAFAEEIKE